MGNRTVMGGTVPPEMEPSIAEAEDRGMEQLGWTHIEEWKDPKPAYTEDVPDWIELPDDFDLSGSRGEYIEITGDSYVYMCISNGASKALVYRQLKSEFYDTSAKEGTCPNCQSYIKRYDEDDYLTCHRCGWQYRPMKERIKNLF